MSRTLVAAVSGLVCTFITCVVANGLASVSRVAAQVNPESLIALDVRARNDATERCFAVKVLQERITHYGAGRLGRARELRLELDLDARDSAELRVYRGSALVSRRRFEGLPEACADRRDAVALSIALALESVIRDLEPELDSNESPEAPAATESSSASSGTRTSAAESDASAVAAPPRESALRTQDARTDARTDAQTDTRTDAPPKAETRAPPSAATTAVKSDDDDDEEEVEEATAPADESPTALSIQLHLGARVLAAALPAPVFTGVLGGAVFFDRTFGVEFSALATAVDSSTLAEGRVRSRLIGGELLGCYAFGFAGLAAQGCAGVLAAACPAQGRDYPVEFPSATLAWAAGTGRIALAWPAEETVSLRLVIQGHANFVRPVLRVDGALEDLSPFWLGGAAGLDLVVSFD